MKEETQKLLSDLYAIRATMSLIAENDDGTEPERRAIGQLEAEQKRIRADIAAEDKNFAATREEKEAEYEKQMKELQRRKEWREESYERDKKRLIHPFCGLFYEFWSSFAEVWEYGWKILLIGFAVGLLACWITAGVFHSDSGDFGATVGINISILFSVFWGIVFSISGIMALCSLRDMKAWVKDAPQKLEEMDRQLNELPNAHQFEMDKLKKEHDETVAALKKRIDECEGQKEPHRALVVSNAEKTSLMVQSGTSAYPLVDVRDWGNVDLLIFYFETGRADDMKEALQLVDSQRQAEALAKAIAMASEALSRSIAGSLDRLRGELSLSFQELSWQMEQQAAQQGTLIEAQTAAQANSQAMNQALLKKISVSSDRLAKQMDRQMKEVHGLY